jgi:type II secretory pathway pseudopilin PulG
MECGRLNIIGIRRAMISIRRKGYTFIELTVVIFLIGLTLVLTVPRFRYAMLTDELKANVRKMVGKIRELRTEAIREQKTYKLCFDLESNRFWIESTDMTDEERALAYEKAFWLPGGVRILDVWFKARGKKVEGKAEIYLTKKGYIEPSAIHLGAEDGREFTIVLRPFLGKVKVFDKYVEFLDI